MCIDFEQLIKLAVTSDSELDEEKILLFLKLFGRSSSVVGGAAETGLILGRLILPFGLLIAFLKQPAIRGLGPL